MPQKITFLSNSVKQVVDHFSIHNSRSATVNILQNSTANRSIATVFLEGIPHGFAEPPSITAPKKHVALVQKQDAPSDWKLDIATAALKSVNPNAALLFEGYQSLIKAGVPREELHNVAGDALLMAMGGGVPGVMLGTTAKAGLAVIPKSISTSAQMKLAEQTVERLMTTLEKRLFNILTDPRKTPDQTMMLFTNRVEKYEKLQDSNKRVAEKILLDPMSEIPKESFNEDYFRAASRLTHEVQNIFSRKHGIPVLHKSDRN